MKVDDKLHITCYAIIIDFKSAGFGNLQITPK